MELLKSVMRLAVCASLLMPGLLPAQTAPENIRSTPPPKALRFRTSGNRCLAQEEPF
jgi:hypothetical protein